MHRTITATCTQRISEVCTSWTGGLADTGAGDLIGWATAALIVAILGAFLVWLARAERTPVDHADLWPGDDEDAYLSRAHVTADERRGDGR